MLRSLLLAGILTLACISLQPSLQVYEDGSFELDGCIPTQICR